MEVAHVAGSRRGEPRLDEEVREAERRLANLATSSDALTDDDARAPDDAPSEENTD